MAENKIQNTIGYHNLNLEELIKEINNNGDELSRALLDKLYNQLYGNCDPERLKNKILENYK